ncbi:unnamed protein product, partial [Ilex paraguariensis]
EGSEGGLGQASDCNRIFRGLQLKGPIIEASGQHKTTRGGHIPPNLAAKSETAWRSDQIK